MSNPEQSERNPEWLPPDEFYHSSSGLKNVKKAFINLQKKKILKHTREKNKFVNSSILENFVETQNVSQKVNIKEMFLPEKADFSWNEAALLTRDYPGHSLVLQSFNKALVILNQNRELLDRIVVELMYKEILRQPEIENLLQEFGYSNPTKHKNVNLESSSKFGSEMIDLGENGRQNHKTDFKIIESSWGSYSRKPLPRWIDFAEFSGETT